LPTSQDNATESTVPTQVDEAKTHNNKRDIRNTGQDPRKTRFLPKKLQFFALQRQNEKNSQTFFKRNPEEEHKKERKNKKEKNAESQEASYITQKLKKVSYHTAAPHSGNYSSLHGSKGATPDKSP